MPEENSPREGCLKAVRFWISIFGLQQLVGAVHYPSFAREQQHKVRCPEAIQGVVHSAKADSCELWSQQLVFLFWGFAENHIYAINLQSNAGDQNRSAAQPAATIGESDINGATG